MKKILIFFFFVSFFPCLSFADCPETSATEQAIQARNDYFLEKYNKIMPDPEDDREALGSCLESVAAIGDIFSMGVTIPSLESIVSSLCGEAQSAIQDRINNFLSGSGTATGGSHGGGGSSSSLQVNDDYIEYIIGKDTEPFSVSGNFLANDRIPKDTSPFYFGVYPVFGIRHVTTANMNGAWSFVPVPDVWKQLKKLKPGTEMTIKIIDYRIMGKKNEFQEGNVFLNVKVLE